MTTTWRDVARKDFEDAVRSRMLWGFIAVFVAFMTMALLSAEQLFPPGVEIVPSKVLAGVAELAQLFIPGIALVAGYLSVVGERRSGSLRILLSYPFTRFDVVVGKLIGRQLVTGTALVIGYAVASGLVVSLYGLPDLSSFLAFIGTGVLLGAAFTGLAVGGSAATATRGRAMASTIGLFMGMVFFWKPVVVGLYYAVTGSLPSLQAEPWYFLLQRLNPLESYRVLSGAALGEEVGAIPRLPLEDIPATATPEQLELTNRVAGELPVYLQDWVAIVVLIAWGLVPLLIGYWRFERSDLG